MKNRLTTTLSLLSLLGLLACPAVLVGCEREGPAERAGEEIDEAGDELEDAIDDIG